MKRNIFLVLSLLMVCACFGQSLIRDPDFRELPTLELENLDSVRLIQIFKADHNGLGRKPLDWKGFLEIEVTLDTAQRMILWRRYNDLADKIIEEYHFDYSGEKNILVKQTISRTSKKYSWNLRNTLIQEMARASLRADSRWLAIDG